MGVKLAPLRHCDPGASRRTDNVGCDVVFPREFQAPGETTIGTSSGSATLAGRRSTGESSEWAVGDPAGREGAESVERAINDLVADLNPEQREAVLHEGSPSWLSRERGRERPAS